VPITATSDTGHEFDHWTGDVTDANAAKTTVTLDEDQEVTAHFVGVPTAVKLASFTAADYLDHVLLTWETATEVDTIGFNVQRGREEHGPYGQVNATMIPSKQPGSVLGATYVYTDTTVGEGAYWYRLEVVRTSGTELADPIQVTHRANRTYLPLVLRAC
jgi:hypothetical protein